VERARWAGPDDLPEVLDLAREAARAMRDQRGGAIWTVREARPEPFEADLVHALTGTGGRRAAVGLIDDAVVGYGVVHPEVLHDGSVLAVVSDLYVTPEARGVGVGEALMDLFIADARADGAVGIDSLALPGDRATKNFFERFGLTARAIVVHRSLLVDEDEGQEADEPIDGGGTEGGVV
jgi:ribosomal protein S18 acetylase RimI-like enzyme